MTTLPPFASTTSVQNELWGEDWPSVRQLWPLELTVDHLNHGSFGAVPTAVLEEQQSWRTRMEENPVRFLERELPVALEEARHEVAAFFAADQDGLVFVRNATTGVSTVLAGVGLQEDDEVVITDHAYGAVRYAVERYAGRAGARVVVAAVDLDADDATVGESILSTLTQDTRLVVLDEITSPTARRVPTATVAAAVRREGVDVLIDGAHAPGMVDIDLSDPPADYWTGNLHKWCCTPRGAGVLWVAPQHRARMQPLVASWGEPQGFPGSFSIAGTDDYTAWLAAPRALRLLAGLDWQRLREHNLALVAHGQDRVARALGLRAEELPASGRGVSMRLVPLPAGIAADREQAAALQTVIADSIGVEVAVTTWRDRGFIRLSGQAYNAPSDYDRLAEHLPSLL